MVAVQILLNVLHLIMERFTLQRRLLLFRLFRSFITDHDHLRLLYRHYFQFSVVITIQVEKQLNVLCKIRITISRHNVSLPVRQRSTESEYTVIVYAKNIGLCANKITITQKVQPDHHLFCHRFNNWDLEKFENYPEFNKKLIFCLLLV